MQKEHTNIGYLARMFLSPVHASNRRAKYLPRSASTLSAYTMKTECPSYVAYLVSYGTGLRTEKTFSTGSNFTYFTRSTS